jgi:hypothetical protein
MNPEHTNQQHDDEDTGRAEDPAVGAAGKGTCSANQQRHQPERNRRPPIENDGVERLAGDLLVGAAAIRNFLVFLGMPENTDPYYLKRTGRWPIFNTSPEGGKIIASRRRLSNYAEQITRGPTAA